MLKQCMLVEHNDEFLKINRDKFIALVRAKLNLRKKLEKQQSCIKKSVLEDTDKERWSDEGGR